MNADKKNPKKAFICEICGKCFLGFLCASAVKKQPTVAKSLYLSFNSANVFLKYLPLKPL
jgi:hypothetical protein